MLMTMDITLSERQETILALIIHEYIDSAQPVGSERLVQSFDLGVSSATVRNDMSRLTEQGLLRQPHTSAGRIPTEEGYRYFVSRLVGETELPPTEKRLISHQFYQARSELGEWLKLAASVLATQSTMASLVTSPHPDRAVFRHVELISTRADQVLLVLVLEGGDVRQEVLSLAEAVGQDELSALAQRLGTAFLGRTAEGIRSEIKNFDTLGREVAGIIAENMSRSDAMAAGDIYRDGLTNVVMQPEFSNSDNLRHALSLLEERTFLEDIISGALSPSVGGVQVVIGGEDEWQDLRDCSMVLARYGAPGFATGALAVLGPTRMPYQRTISAVRYVADLMSDMLDRAFTG